MAKHRVLALILLAVIASPVVAHAAVGADGKPVPTQNIIIPPDPDGDAGGAARPAAPDATKAAPASNEPVPVVEYDFTKLPAPVQQLREKLIAAAKSGDINELKPIFAANHTPPDLGADPTAAADPIAYLKSLSGDVEGREVLAIMLDILSTGYVHVDVGTPQDAYVWPYFARYPIDKLTGRQMVELFRILTSSDFDEMKSFGAYQFYRLGIAPDGTWAYFEAGD
jgi:hypothetical protein